MFKGVDISNWQRGLDFNAVKNWGANACIVKATEGTGFVNPILVEQVNGTVNSGMKLGFYHFYQNGGVAEAKHFVNTIKAHLSKMSIKPVLDVETSYSMAGLIDFINYVEKELNCTVMGYCNLSYAKALSGNAKMKKRPLWLAYYGTHGGS